MRSYLLFQSGGKPFLAIPQGDYRKALSLVPATTWKKKFVLYYLQTAVLIKYPLPCIVYHNDISIFTTSIYDISCSLKNQGLHFYKPLLIMWNREYKRNRAYLWLGDTRNCQDMAFAKIGIQESNENPFKKEYEALTVLGNQKITFMIPRPLLLSCENEISILLTSSLPSRNTQFTFLPWHDIEVHLSTLADQTRKQVTYSQLEKLDWFKLFQTSVDPKIIQVIKKILYRKPISIGFIHGDMGSENTFLIGDQLWIIDWEKSSQEGPIATDCVAYWLGKTAQISGLNHKIVHSFYETFIRHSHYGSDDILLALCYLTLMDFPPAVHILKQTTQDNFSAWME